MLISLSDYIENVEMGVSVTSIPPYTKISRKWQPEDEFAYVYRGFFVLHQENGPDEFYKEGDVGRVPVDQFHSISTQEEGTTILVFSIIK